MKFFKHGKSIAEPYLQLQIEAMPLSGFFVSARFRCANVFDRVRSRTCVGGLAITHSTKPTSVFVGLRRWSTLECLPVVSVWMNSSALPADAREKALKHLFQPFHPFNRYRSVQADSSEVKDQTLWAIKFWSEAIAVGNLNFVEKVKSELGFKAAHREVIEGDGTYALRGASEAYESDFTGEKMRC